MYLWIAIVVVAGKEYLLFKRHIKTETVSQVRMDLTMAGIIEPLNRKELELNDYI